jgi:hypoxanthine phosphoribosyltransferase
MNLNDHIKKVLVTEDQINARCKELGELINKEYDGKETVLLSLLRGSVPFVTTLAKYITIPVTFDYMKASSYHGGTTSSGNVAVSVMPASNLENKHVIVVEDIVDTGFTLSTVMKLLSDLKPASLEICTLLDKPEMRKVTDLKLKYIGFEVPAEFVVGYGLDYNELYRQLPYVGVLKEEIYSK